MRLLLITQTLDSRDPILGFFHAWVAEFARSCSSVTVITQQVGHTHLPSNVRVFSLGKETGTRPVFQVLRFWALQWRLRHTDAVLVHMVPLWIVLGWPLWVLLRVPMYLWYEARGARWPLRVALRIVRKVFSASAAGMPVATPKSIITGHGIDATRFVPGGGEREPGFLVTVGRITRAKRLGALLRALALLPVHFHLTIIGVQITPDDQNVIREMDDFVRRHALKRRVVVMALPPEEVVPILQRAEVFLSASTTSLDKALLEAMACGCLVVSSSTAAASVLPSVCQCTDETLAETVQRLLAFPEHEQEELRRDLRKRVEQRHSLVKLIERLVEEMTPL